MRLYAGIDLHSSNNYIGIMDQDYKRLFGRRQPNDLNRVLKVLEPFKAELERFYQQKMAKRNGAVATKALANKLARASYFIMRDQVPFDEDMLFR